MKLKDNSTPTTDLPYELFISPEFEKIIMKMNPEITGIRKNKIEVISQISFSAYTYTTDMSYGNKLYIFRIGLFFGGGESTLKGGKLHYSNEVNKWFKHLHPLESEHINYEVDEIELPKVKTEYQRFLERF
jgi:hypothetical protein